MHMRNLVAAGLAVALLAVPVTAADDPDELMPPTDLRGEHDPDTDTVNLTWMPPEAGADAYNVYRNGQWIGSTQSTWFVADMDLGLFEPVAVFQVTAVHVEFSTQEDGSGGGESAPSGPAAFGQSGPCEIGSTSIKPDQFPFVFTGLHPECLPDIPPSDVVKAPSHWRGF